MVSSLLFTVEGVHQGWPNEPILYRIRVLARGTRYSYPGQVIRYLTAPNPPKGASGVPDHRGKLLAFDTVPEVIGVWAWPPGHAHGIADAREAGPVDLEKCKDTLSRLHALGIAYGRPLKKHSFLVCGGDALLLQGLGGSFKTTDKEVLGCELEGLEQVLAQQPSELEKFNAPVDIKLSDRLVEFQSHGLTHPFVRWQLANSKPVTLTSGQHREMVSELAANNYRWTEEDMDRAKQRFGGSADVAVVGAAGEPTG